MQPHQMRQTSQEGFQIDSRSLIGLAYLTLMALRSILKTHNRKKINRESGLISIP